MLDPPLKLGSSMLLLLLACGVGALPSADPTPDPVLDSGEGDEGESEERVTWYGEVRPLLAQHCTRCHAEGGLGTGDFTDYGTAAVMAEILLDQIELGQMPPPASDPTCRDYHDSDILVVGDEALDTLRDWIVAGTPEGDPDEAAEVPVVSDELEGADVEVRLAEAYAPSFPVDGNEWRCFVVGGVPDEDYFITAMQAEVDHSAMVHHIVLYSVDASALSPAWLDPSGFDCALNEESAIARDAIGVWAPGMRPVELPEGIGLAMNGGEPLLLEFHYFDPGNLEPGAVDRSGYVFRTSDTVETPVLPYVWGPTDFVIPADDAAYTATNSFSAGLGYDYTIYTMWPHMHVLGDAYDVRVTDAQGEEDCLLTADGYSFNNQYSYTFLEPYVIESGSQVTHSCTWNNSSSNPDLIHDPPVETGFGAATDDEMCYLYGLYSVAPTEPSVRAEAVNSGEIALLQATEDLDLDGEIVAAINYGGDDLELAGVAFVGDVTSGIPYALNQPDFDGDPATWTPLELLAYTDVYAVPGSALQLDLPVESGRDYRLQLVIFEPGYTAQGSRSLDVWVEGEHVLEGLEAHTESNEAAIRYTLDLTAGDELLEVVVAGADGGDGYAILSGLVLEADP